MAESESSHVIAIDFMLTTDRARQQADEFRQEQEARPVQLRAQAAGGQPPGRPPVAVAAPAPPPPPEPSRPPIPAVPVVAQAPAAAQPLTPAQQQLSASFQASLNEAAARGDRAAVRRMMDQARAINVPVSEPRDIRTYQQQIDYGAAAYARSVQLRDLQSEGVRRRDFDELTARSRRGAVGLTAASEAEVERFTPRSDKLESAVDQLVASIVNHAKAEDQAARTSERATRATADEQRAIEQTRFRFGSQRERADILRRRIERAEPGTAEELEARQQAAAAYVDAGRQQRQSNYLRTFARRLLIAGGAREVVSDIAADYRTERELRSTSDLARQLQLATAAADRASTGFVGGTVRTLSGLVEPVFDPQASRLRQGIGLTTLAGAGVAGSLVAAQAVAGAGGTGTTALTAGGIGLVGTIATLGLLAHQQAAADRAVEEANQRLEIDRRAATLRDQALAGQRGLQIVTAPNEVERQRLQIEFNRADAARQAQQERTFAYGKGDEGKDLVRAADQFEKAANDLAKSQFQEVNRQAAVRDQQRDVETERLEQLARGGSEREATVRAARRQFDVRFADAFNRGETGDELNRMIREFEAQQGAVQANINRAVAAADIAGRASETATRQRTARDPVGARVTEIVGETFAQASIADATDRGRILRKGLSELFGFLGQTGNQLSDLARDSENQRRVSRLRQLGFFYEAQTQAVEAQRQQELQSLPRVPAFVARFIGLDRVQAEINARARAGQEQATIDEQRRQALRRGEIGGLFATLRRDPLGAQLAQINAGFEAANAGLINFSPQSIGLRIQAALQRALARREFEEDRRALDTEQGGRRQQLESLLRRDPAGAETAGIVTRTRLEEQALRRRGLAPEADEARQQGILQLQLQQREFLDRITFAGIDPRFISTRNPRDQEDPAAILNTISKGIENLERPSGTPEDKLREALQDLPDKIASALRSLMAR